MKAEDTTKACLAHEEQQIANKLVQKWQNSNSLKPGQRVIHPALRDDFQEGHANNLIFGRPNHGNSDETKRNFVEETHVCDILGGGHSSFTESNMTGKYFGGEECKAIKQDLNEKKVYKSAKRELGRSFHRGHTIPEFMQDEKYRYGVKNKEKNDDAKLLLYPHQFKSENEENNSTKLISEKSNQEVEHIRNVSNTNYAKSHGSYLPGQQRKRNYKWPIDPTATIFGVKSQGASGRCSSKGVSEALHHDCYAPTLKNNEKVKTAHELENDSHVFGKKTSSNTETAAACLKSIENQFNDREIVELDDLGRSVRPGFRNAYTEKRSFGCPSIRTDIPEYERHSVADTQNYGNDVNAEYLLRPTQCSSFGIEENEFHVPRTKSYVQTIFGDCGYKINENDLNLIWAENCDKNQCMSIDQFQEVYNILYLSKEKQNVQ